MTNEEVYQKLKKELRPEELVEAVFLPKKMTKAEEEASHKEMQAFRIQMLKNRTEEQRIMSELLRLKYLMEDYIEIEPFSELKTFGKYLKEYVEVFKKNRKEIASDLNIHPTKLSRLINEKEEPNIELAYRLEKHSGNLIPALYWWKLTVKKQAYFIEKDEEKRKIEAAKVQNAFEYIH